MSNFVEKLNDLISETGKDIKTIATELGINSIELYHWRKGKRNYLPSLEKFIKLADYFSCSILFLFGTEEENSLPNPKHELPCFSERLSAIIKEKNIPITHLARKCELANTSMIYNWKNGKGKPQIENLINLSKALNCSPDYLLGREN